MPLRFNPFAALLPDSYIIAMAKLQINQFALEPNDKQTRKKIETSIYEVLRKNGVYYSGIICDSSNNTSDLIDQNKICVYLEFQTTSFSKLSKYNLIAGPLKWDHKTASYFTEKDYLALFTDLEFEVEKLSL